MIVSAFPFLNELDLLRLKLEYTSPFVDQFLLVESTVTFSGHSKPLYFQENKDQFAGYPITHVIVDDMPFGPDTWARQNHQRAVLLDEVTKLRPEIVLFTDTDEITALHVVQSFKELNAPIATMDMVLLTYWADRLNPAGCCIPKICRFDGRSPDRAHHHYPIIEQAGWHFAYTGSRETLLEKLNATSHFSEPFTRAMWQAAYRGYQPKLEVTTDYPRSKLPNLVQADAARYGLKFYSDLDNPDDEKRERYPIRNPGQQARK